MTRSSKKLLVTVKLRAIPFRKGDKQYVMYEVTLPKHIVEDVLRWGKDQELVVLVYNYRGVKSLLLVPVSEFMTKILQAEQTSSSIQSGGS